MLMSTRESALPRLNIQAYSLEGQRAAVTGASSGIGEAIARAQAEAGASVAVNHARGADRAGEVVADICAARARAVAVKADVSQEAEVQAIFATMLDELEGIDIPVINAGLQADASVAEMTLEQWNNVIGINLTGQFRCSREAVRHFLRQGVRPIVSSAAGKIVCVSSVHDVIPWAGHANYAKGGVAMFMKTMAREPADKKIRVNRVSPGAIKTPINKAAWDTPEAEAKLIELIPYGRVGVVDDTPGRWRGSPATTPIMPTAPRSMWTAG